MSNIGSNTGSNIGPNTNIPKPKGWFFNFETGLLLWCTLFALNIHVSWHDPIRFSNARECFGINCRFFCFFATALTLFADAYALRAILSENEKYPHKDMIVLGILAVFLYLVYYAYTNTPHYTREEPDEFSCLSDYEKEKIEEKKEKFKTETPEPENEGFMTQVVNQMNEWAGNITELTKRHDDIDPMKEENIWSRKKRLSMWVLVMFIDIILVYRDMRIGRYAYNQMLKSNPDMFKMGLETIIRFVGMVGPVIDYMNIKLNYEFEACKYGLDEIWDK